MGFDVVRVLLQRALEVRDGLLRTARALVDPGALVTQIGKCRVLGQRPVELLLRARVITRVLVGEAQVGPRLRRVHAGEAVVRVVRIPDFLQHALEALRCALELPSIEVEDALVVAARVPPLDQRRQEGHQTPRPHGGRASRRCHAGVPLGGATASPG